MKETARAHLITIGGWPVYVYTNNPEVRSSLVAHTLCVNPVVSHDYVVLIDREK